MARVASASAASILRRHRTAFCASDLSPAIGEQEGEPGFGGSQPWYESGGRRVVVVQRHSGREDAYGPGVFVPSAVPHIPQLVAAIDNRLADIAAEIGALDAAKAQLTAPGAGGAAPAVTERIAPRRGVERHALVSRRHLSLPTRPRVAGHVS